MAESDGKPASSPLSTEEADRLSEKFKPSWESEPDPPTIPKVEPPSPEPPKNLEPPKPIEPAKVLEPAKPIEPAKILEPAKPIEPAKILEAAKPLETAKSLEPAKNPEAPKPVLKQTLLGIAAPEPEPRPAEAPSKAPDDLDWELPTNPAPERAVEAQPVIEPPPKSNPSGVGQTYVPKDAGAPPIVLKEDVKRAEEAALAQLDAEHKARSAPTVLKFKAIESPQKAAADELDPDAFVAPKRGLGVYVGLGAGALLVALIGIMVVVKGTSPRTVPETLETKPAEPAVKTEPEPPPPPPTPAATEEPTPTPEPKAAEPVVEPVSDPKRAEPPKAAEPKPAVEPALDPPKPVTPKPAPAPKPAAAAPKAPKPTSTAPKAPATKPASKPASGGIVRDAPF